MKNKLLHTALSRISDQTRERVRGLVDKKDEMKKVTIKNLSIEIKAYLVKHNMSESQFAEKAGVGSERIKEIVERNTKYISFFEVEKILDLIGMEIVKDPKKD